METTIAKQGEESSLGSRETPGKAMRLEGAKPGDGNATVISVQRSGNLANVLYCALVWESQLRHALQIFSSEFPIWEFQVALEDLHFHLVLR